MPDLIFAGTKMKEDHKYEDEKFSMEIRNGILFISYKRGLKFDMEVSRRFVSQRLEFIGEKEYPAIVTDEGMVSIDKPARDFFASPEGVKGVTAVAFIQKTLFSKMLIDFFLGANRSSVHAKAFSEVNDAIVWIENLQAENSIKA
jgi:hypothetical protein